MKLTLSRVTAACLRLALGSALIATTVDVSAAGQFTVSVARRDLRPLPNVALQVTGAVNRQDVTDANGRTEFPDLPRAGGVTITPLRSGFRFKPNQFTIPDLANPSAVAFVAYPTATDLAISITSDDPSPL